MAKKPEKQEIIVRHCNIKQLNADQRVTAAKRAIEINRFNAPRVESLGLRGLRGGDGPSRLVLLTRKYWGIKGVKLTVGFMDSPPADLRRHIISHMNGWGKYCNVQFVASNVNPQVRISRSTPYPNDGYWSYLGVDILGVPEDEPTMNLQDFTMKMPESEFFRVVRHETGHTLGFEHEHLRQEIVNSIDVEKAVAYFKETQGWSRKMVMDQVLTPLSAASIEATERADPKSIMCYWLPAKIMKNGKAVVGGSDIDKMDADFAALKYPKKK